jgi:hypothetical protein
LDLDKAIVSLLTRVRQISGIRWDQIAEILGTDHSCLSQWLQGTPLPESNEKLLTDLLHTLEQADLGKSFLNRRAIFLDHGGIRGYDLLLEGRFQDFVTLFEDFRESGLPKEPLAEHVVRPLPPAILANATYSGGDTAGTVCLHVADAMSEYLGPRRREEGPHSGEEFREEMLMPLLESHEHVILDFDGVQGVIGGWLDEVFGDLDPDLIPRITCVSINFPGRIADIKSFMHKGTQ